MSLKLSSNLRSQLLKVFWITVAWVLIGQAYIITIYVALIDLERDTSDLDLGLYLISTLVVGLLAGTVGGSVIVFFWAKWLRTQNYGASLWNILWTYSLVYVIVLIPSSLFQHSQELDVAFYDQRVFDELISTTFSIGGIHNFFFWMVMLIVTLIVLLVNDKYGPGVFMDFLLGKYFRPKREQRIFMFLDLRSSTTIAEELGEDRYFSLLKDLFKFATPSILNNKGEIYQYVGDEIVISWKTNEGIENTNCINCFYDIRDAMKLKSEYFKSHYDLIPEFKAGLHYGFVMAGEIGVVKRDIAFSGDVLNTTSRIQGKCNDLGVNILISGFLLEKLNLTSETYAPRQMGDMELRGKKEKVTLYTL